MFPKALTGYLKYHTQSSKSDVDNLETLIFSEFHFGQVIAWIFGQVIFSSLWNDSDFIKTFPKNINLKYKVKSLYFKTYNFKIVIYPLYT